MAFSAGPVADFIPCVAAPRPFLSGWATLDFIGSAADLSARSSKTATNVMGAFSDAQETPPLPDPSALTSPRLTGTHSWPERLCCSSAASASDALAM